MRLTTRHLTLLIALLIPGSEAAAQGPPDLARVREVAAMLPKAPRGVGRPIGDRAAWTAVANWPSAKTVVKKAEALLRKPLPEPSDELYLEFSRNGNRSRYQTVYLDRHRRLGPLVVAECLENEGRFLPAIEKTILAICDDKSWVLPAHDRGLGNFKGTNITIDLFSSGVGWNLPRPTIGLATSSAPRFADGSTTNWIAGSSSRMKACSPGTTAGCGGSRRRTIGMRSAWPMSPARR